MKELTKQGMEGTLSFPESLEKRLQLFSSNKEHIEQLIQHLKQNITPSILRNKAFFQTYADHIYIITGGFAEYVYPVMQEFGIEKSHVIANTFTFDKKGEITGYDTKNPLAQEKGKVKAIQQLGLEGNSIVIGDGYTDYQMKEQGVAKRFYAFIENTNRSSVTAKADEVLFSFDEFLYMYNFPRPL